MPLVRSRRPAAGVYPGTGGEGRVFDSRASESEMKEREIAILVDSASIQLAKAIIANGRKIVSQRPDNSVVQIDLLTVPERFVSALSVGRYREDRKSVV